jgi:TonB family protein
MTTYSTMDWTVGHSGPCLVIRALSLIGVILAAGCAPLPLLPVAPMPSEESIRDSCRLLKIIHRGEVRFPRSAMASGQEGWVRMQVDVERDGVPLNIRVVDSSPKGIFEEAAVASMKEFRFANRQMESCGMVFKYQLK